MMAKAKNQVAALFWLALWPAAGAAQDLTARDVITLNDQQRRSSFEQMTLVMKLINDRGKERTRQLFQASRTDAENNQKVLVQFVAPADVKGTSFLLHEHTGRDDDQWLYLPALRRVRRISASEKSNSFMGSDFAYEDLGSEELEDYDYKLQGAEPCGDTECYVIEATPSNEKERRESGYSKRKLWIANRTFVVLKQEYYDKSGDLYKVFSADDIRLVSQTDKWRAHRLDMENLKTGHKTVILVEDFVVDQRVNDEVFTLRYLERGR